MRLNEDSAHPSPCRCPSLLTCLQSVLFHLISFGLWLPLSLCGLFATSPAVTEPIISTPAAAARGRRRMNNLAAVGCVARIDTANPKSEAPAGCQRCGAGWTDVDQPDPLYYPVHTTNRCPCRRQRAHRAADSLFWMKCQDGKHRCGQGLLACEASMDR